MPMHAIVSSAFAARSETYVDLHVHASPPMKQREIVSHSRNTHLSPSAVLYRLYPLIVFEGVVLDDTTNVRRAVDGTQAGRCPNARCRYCEVFCVRSGKFSGMNATETHCNHFQNRSKMCLGIIRMEFKPRTEEHASCQTHGRKGTGGLPSSEFRPVGNLQQRDTGMTSLAPPLSIRVIVNGDR
ncbi:hypothetical protein EDD16DRAFT_1096912 [Pisolithus croceorrhizus]|nr:hypothetical protein EDD16DRAFT_1096912 [Pisolithus croceorrhizus]